MECHITGRAGNCQPIGQKLKSIKIERKNEAGVIGHIDLFDALLVPDLRA